ncbi:uncharacterized protein Bfra_006151ia [Botrytis fragariae]|uniref:2EXR domain-containing protein n=1 Tax=Botrytis fragariae TaxID=1964551 RepID=A0A8H6ASK0_9HELO|nr:uncharacterized protein Bfra_006151ia [Botrytis fragariae]KAF5872788.1 hypothetical protein Bfra_006151ia [Botrytis fragariae]
MNSQDQSSNGKALEKFTIFPQLPPDIRIRIWKATLTPRLLSRWCLSANSSRPLNAVYIPSLLGVNAEARYEALKCYQNIAISAERLHDLRLSGYYWVPKGEELRILFNPEIDVVVDESLRCDVYMHGLDDAFAMPYRIPLLIDPDFVRKVQVSPNVFMNSSWNWRQTSCNWQDNYFGFEDMDLENYAVRRMGFKDLRFNNLNEFIVQDVDCALPHQLESPEIRARCKEILEIMFKAETTRESEDHIQVSIPKIVIRLGAKVGLCDHCTVRFTPWTKWPLEQPHH